MFNVAHIKHFVNSLHFFTTKTDFCIGHNHKFLMQLEKVIGVNLLHKITIQFDQGLTHVISTIFNYIYYFKKAYYIKSKPRIELNYY